MHVKMERISHPSYGQLGVNKSTSSAKRPLYGSSLEHSNVISFTLRESTLCRELNTDRYSGGKVIASFEMSAAQFAQLITSMNEGSGVPVTLTYVNGEDIERCPFQSKVEQFSNEFADTCKDVIDKANDMFNFVTARFEDKKPLNAAERKEVLETLERIKRTITANMPYVNDSFARQMEQTVTEAKAEFEASVQNRLTEMGLNEAKDSSCLNLQATIGEG